MTTTATSAEELRHRMVEQLAREGALHSSEWRAAFDAVPRERFVHGFTRRTERGLVTYDQDDPGYLEAVYADDSLNTQYDEHGTATSSSSQPTVMAHMVEALAPASDTLPVLDLGTGPGYNAALLSHRYGSARVVSRDVDPALVSAADDHLAAAGYAPTLSVGDGAEGCPDHAPYGALIATYGTGRIPDAWRAQVARGGNIVAALGYGLISLTIGEHARATGHFLPILAAFMKARTGPDVAPTPARGYAGTLATAEGHTREIELPAKPDERMPSFLGSLAHPDVLDLSMLIEGQTRYGLIHPNTRSWARITPNTDGTARLDHGGPRNLWTERAPLLEAWRAAGGPNADAYRLTVHPDGTHELHLGEQTWPLPS
ncbi:methyltransferase domain-containing protein [Streptomyces sulphureus]|uniref:methyltransferase domain-containing protein n=1 Tax=Streptomyces sulphureus TaxID=47758 RepID=UPI00036C1F25|nr:methyltransferase domain-containing protein [Streptomyces sulphureus]